MLTGHLAHWGDVIGVALLIVTNTSNDRERAAIAIAAILYGLVGSIFINETTRDGSASDLRGRSEAEKCAQARIMTDGWRGGLNDLISVLGVLVAWQALFTCGDGRCKGPTAPIKVVLSVFTDAYSSARKSRRVAAAMGSVALTVATTLLPTYSNYVNTSGQHGQLRAADYDLPDCFDP